jgi:hypothetical protein
VFFIQFILYLPSASKVIEDGQIHFLTKGRVTPMPPASSAKLARDRLQKAAPGEPVKVWVYSAFQKDHWLARSPGDMTHAEHPGTAIRIDGELYEIVTAEGTVEPGYELRYGLKQWDSKHAVRKIIPYSPETQSQAAEVHLEEAYRQDLRKRIVRLYFLAGMAPDPLQRKWEMETALSMTVVSAASSLTNIFVFMALVQFFGRTPGNRVLASLIEYTGVDSFVRFLWIVLSGKPHGTLILSLPYLLWEAVMRPDKRAAKSESARVSLQADEVIRRPKSAHLTIRSMLFDDMLAGTKPILFEGAVYQPLHSYEEGQGLKRRWVYEFEQSDAQAQTQYPEYTRPREPGRQKIVEESTRRRDLAHIFATIWGTYPREEQLRLQTKYQFPANHWTTVTSGLLLAASVLQGWGTFLMGGSNALYVCPVYLVFESLYRLYQSKGKGQPAGSVLGLILKFFVKAPR